MVKFLFRLRVIKNVPFLCFKRFRFVSCTLIAFLDGIRAASTRPGLFRGDRDGGLRDKFLE